MLTNASDGSNIFPAGLEKCFAVAHVSVTHGSYLRQGCLVPYKWPDEAVLKLRKAAVVQVRGQARYRSRARVRKMLLNSKLLHFISK
jgi:hypothetical protein